MLSAYLAGCEISRVMGMLVSDVRTYRKGSKTNITSAKREKGTTSVISFICRLTIEVTA